MQVLSAFDRETRGMLDDSIRRFASGAGDEVRWSQVRSNGWLALGLPEEFGGTGEAIGDLVTLLRAAGAGLWRLPLLACLGEACGALLAAPAGPERDRLLAAIARGEIIARFAGGGGRRVTASAADGAFVLDGNCAFLEERDQHDVLLVLARTGASADEGLFVIDADVEALGGERLDAIDGRVAVNVKLNAVAARMIAAGGDILQQAKARAHILAAAEAAGLARAALDATIAYLGARRQFGQPILKFQAIQHRLVELHIQECELSALLDAACIAHDQRQSDLIEKIWRLRALASKAAITITQQAIQLHGGMGMTCELPIGAYYKRAMQLDALYGSYEHALDRLASRLPPPAAGECHDNGF